MAISVTVTSLTRENNGTGRFIIIFSDGSVLEFADIEALSVWANELDGADTFVKKMMVLYGLKRSSDLSNATAIVGRTMTVDWTQNPNRVIVVA